MANAPQMRRITLAQQAQIVAHLQEALGFLQSVEWQNESGRTSPAYVIGATSAHVRLSLMVFGVVPVKRMDVDEAGEPRVLEGTAVVTGPDVAQMTEVQRHV